MPTLKSLTCLSFGIDLLIFAAGSAEEESGDGARSAHHAPEAGA